ncbi:MAG: fatty acid desaturase [Phycisphaerales bacterium]|nr:fatty acid desaturase [Phycisphaerales bacterium]
MPSPPSSPRTADLPATQSPAEPRLALPDTIVRGQIVWPYAIAIGLVHVLALAAFIPWLFSWTGLIVMVLGIHVFGQGINLCYHRILTHRSAVLPRWLERFFVVIALCCMEDTPAKWVAIHRYHHKHSDEQDDPHSPLVAFLWGHVGWLLVRNKATHNIDTYRQFAGDVLRDPFYMRLEKGYLWVWIYVAHAVLFFLVGFAIGWAVHGVPMAGVQFGLSLLVWGVIVRTVAVWHITWSVNSLSHMFGYSNYETSDESRNNWLVALLTVGEGWHNNHHHDPASASNQHRWWEFDVTWWQIRMLEMVGLAKKVRRPKCLSEGHGEG